MKKSVIEKYARLIARVGAGIEKGDPVIIYSSVEIYEFIETLVKECYLAGASKVDVEWSNDEITKLSFEYRTMRSIKTIPAWKSAKMREIAKTLPCRISIISEAPDSLVGIDRKKFEAARANNYKRFKKYYDEIEGNIKWTIAAFPGKAWASAVFPEEKPEKAKEKLLSAILESVMVDEKGDAEEAWKKHNEMFLRRCEKLNKYKFDRLEYKSGNGTDFSVSLIPQTHWCGGGEYTKGGKYFNPNMPTEEIFISPMKGKAEGKLVSTMPLSYSGQIIDGFSLTFKDGRVTDFEAKVGYELLKEMIESDEGASMLGEVALVPQKNPISKQGILFYETLFDENASCHVALGNGYIDTVDSYAERTLEECRALGINESRIHVDFMIGADDMSIVGYKDGIPTEIFINGEFAPEFDV
ncbi:MAG: aminopeptidase [Eubacteriales bacterium]